MGVGYHNIELSYRRQLVLIPDETRHQTLMLSQGQRHGHWKPETGVETEGHRFDIKPQTLRFPSYIYVDAQL